MIELYGLNFPSSDSLQTLAFSIKVLSVSDLLQLRIELQRVGMTHSLTDMC